MKRNRRRNKIKNEKINTVGKEKTHSYVLQDFFSLIPVFVILMSGYK